MIGIVSKNVRHFNEWCEKNKGRGVVVNIQREEQLKNQSFTEVIDNIQISDKTSDYRVKELERLLASAKSRIV